MKFLEYLDSLYSDEEGYSPREHALFGDNDLNRIEQKYGFEFDDEFKSYFAKFPQGCMYFQDAMVQVEGQVLAASEDDQTDLSKIFHCGSGPSGIESVTEDLRTDKYLNDGWADSHIVFAASCIDHPFTLEISGPDKGSIYFFDLWNAGANPNPSDYVYRVASSLGEFICSLKPEEE